MIWAHLTAPLLILVGIETVDVGPIIDAALQKTIKARNLSDSDAAFSKAAAATYVFASSCDDPQHKLRPDPFYSFQIVANADPAVPYQAAVLEMIALILNVNMGHQPGKAVCDHLLGIANFQK